MELLETHAPPLRQAETRYETARHVSDRNTLPFWDENLKNKTKHFIIFTQDNFAMNILNA